MLVIRLALQSLFNRRLTTVMTILSIGLSIALFFGVERVRQGARESFRNTISGTDLIVGARTGPMQLLLYSVFHLGNATNNISYETFEEFTLHPAVKWTIPYSLGDSHRGYRVVATNENFYEHYRYRRTKKVKLATGMAATGMFEVVLGSEVAQKLQYQVGERIVLAHGVSAVALQKHDDKPFSVVGILEKTATPIDRSLYITLEGMEAIHADWGDGAPPVPGEEVAAETLLKSGIEIEQITAFLLKANSPMEVLHLQRALNEYEAEPIMGVMPGVALDDLWQSISYAETGLQIVSGFVIIVGLLGMLISIYNSLNERRREMAILRSVGAGPNLIFSLLVSEAFLLTSLGLITGVVMVYLGLFILQPWVETQFGFYLPIRSLSGVEYAYVGCILSFGVVLGVVPAWRAYRNTLVDGLAVRL